MPYSHPNASQTVYAVERGSIEAAKTEANSSPSANKYEAYLPATGARALAAWSADVMWVAPTPGLLKNAAAQHTTIAAAAIVRNLSLIHISEPTRLGMISYAVF